MVWMRVGRVAACWALAMGSARGQASAGWCDRVKALTEEPAVAAAHWGVSVTALDGTVLCAVNEGQLFRPASNDKLFTMAAALALLGPDRRFMTTVVADGAIKDGVLKGNLRLLGGGDANFGAHDVPYVAPADRPKPEVPEPATIADIEDLAAQIAAAGGKSVEGDVVGDDSYFAWEPYPHGWTIDDLNTDYGAPVSALTIHDNWEEIQVAAGAVTTAPDVPYYTIADQSVAQKECGLRLDRELGSRAVTLYGHGAAGAKPCRVNTAIHDPAEYAALALKLALERRGVRVTGSAIALHVPPRAFQPATAAEGSLAAAIGGATADAPVKINSGSSCHESKGISVLATHRSVALGDDLNYTVKASDNLHAEILLENLGSAFGCAHTEAASLAVVRAYLKQVGIAATDFVLYDGSGLSGHDLVAPRALTQMLVYAAKQKWAASYKAALPVGGVDGTLASRFLPPGSTLKGKVFAKTGTLGESRALSGYLTAASGGTVVFSVMVDNHRPGDPADRVAMDRMVEAIAAGN